PERTGRHERGGRRPGPDHQDDGTAEDAEGQDHAGPEDRGHVARHRGRGERERDRQRLARGVELPARRLDLASDVGAQGTLPADEGGGAGGEGGQRRPRAPRGGGSPKRSQSGAGGVPPARLDDPRRTMAKLRAGPRRDRRSTARRLGDGGGAMSFKQYLRKEITAGLDETYTEDEAWAKNH